MKSAIVIDRLVDDARRDGHCGQDGSVQMTRKVPQPITGWLADAPSLSTHQSLAA